MKPLLTSLLTAFIVTSCYKDKTKIPTDCDVVVSYSLDIKPIINTSCVTNLGPGTGCHDAWIFQYDQVVATIQNGTLESELFVDHTMPVMPNNFGIDSLTSDELKSVRCWIEQGYAEN